MFKRNIERLNLLANPSNKGEERKGCEEKILFRKNGFIISRHL